MSEECIGNKETCDKDPCCKDEGVVDCKGQSQAEYTDVSQCPEGADPKDCCPDLVPDDPE